MSTRTGFHRVPWANAHVRACACAPGAWINSIPHALDRGTWRNLEEIWLRYGKFMEKRSR